MLPQGAGSAWEGAWPFSLMHHAWKIRMAPVESKMTCTPPFHFPPMRATPGHSIAAADAAIDASANEMSAL
jgi:hypothetical protein